MKIIKTLLFSFLILFLSISGALALDIPELNNKRIHDQANILIEPDETALDRKLAEFEKITSNQIAILILKSLEGENMEDYSIRVATKWKLGTKKHDNGLLILLAMKEKKYRMEVGYGLEGVLPDSLAGELGRRYIVTNFEGKNYANGVRELVDSIILVSKNEYKSDPKFSKPKLKKEDKSNLIMIAFGVLIFVAGIASLAHEIFGGIIGAIGAPLLSSFLFHPGTAFLAIAAVVGLLVGLISKYLLDIGIMVVSSGGGGDGGFSGGGGGFGGGGASGGW